ncbi:MAG: DUF1538 domain-containing protein [Candidatus Ventricola sp.]
MSPKLKEKIMESAGAVLPITAIVLVLSVALVPVEVGTMMLFLVGAGMLVVGMGLFQLGSEMAMTPLGEGVGAQTAGVRRLQTVLLIAFVMGVIVTLAEPDLQVLAQQVPSIPNRVLIVSVAVGVGAFLALAVLRILLKISLPNLLTALYLLLIALTFFVPKEFLPVAFDSGGVTTGPITVPFIMAMGVGMAAVRGDRNAADDSFGLVALSSVGPVLIVLLLGCVYHPQATAYSAGAVASVTTTQDVAQVVCKGIPQYAWEVAVALFPLLAVFALFQLRTRRFPKRQRARILVGFAYTFAGLVLFLCGVNIGFAPVGAQLGHALAKAPTTWLLVPVGMLIGYTIVKAEPAIQVLNHQIQSVTNGAISARAMNRCLSVGVCAAVGLAMLRVILRIPVQMILIPGYLLALALTRFVPRLFVGIAFDSGGVASGPMTTTFLLPLCIGACQSLGGSLMTDAFGVVALVALTPLIAVQLMGVAYQRKLRRAEALPPLPEDADEIIELEEGRAL